SPPPLGPWIQDMGGAGGATPSGTPEPAAPRNKPGGRGGRGARPSSGGGESCKLVLSCRAIHTSTAPDANTRIAFDLEKELNTMTNYFGTNVIPGNAASDAANLTYSCEFTVTLKRPIRF